MIRLSEAIAKANCVDQVTPEFVNEAFKLLRQSIISVEKDDVEFEDEAEAETADVDAGAEDDEMDAEATPAPPRPKTQITFDRYNAIANSIVRRVGDDQNDAEDGVEEQDLITWYLETKEDDLDSQEDMEAEQSLCRKVIKKMVRDNILMQIRGEGLADDAGEGLRQDRVVYVMHPNAAIEEM